jgi:hypothetical protein
MITYGLSCGSGNSKGAFGRNIDPNARFVGPALRSCQDRDRRRGRRQTDETIGVAPTDFPLVGYSTKTLPDKLGYKPGMSIVFVALPESLAWLTDSVDFGKVARRQDWARPLGPTPFDIVHAFTQSRAELAAGLPRLRKAIVPAGMIWVSWPKKAAKIATDVTEDVVREEALKHDLVDVKVAAIDTVWSGLKLVIRRERR